jgi:hypothetical protein
MTAFDDVDFAGHGARMHEPRTDIAADDEIAAAVEVRSLLGLVELGL